MCKTKNEQRDPKDATKIIWDLEEILRQFMELNFFEELDKLKVELAKENTLQQALEHQKVNLVKELDAIETKKSNAVKQNQEQQQGLQDMTEETKNKMELQKMVVCYCFVLFSFFHAFFYSFLKINNCPFVSYHSN